ncbi:MAG: hypothetical protein HYS24_12995 [Ignavibacteriales bacterium]|nr:hypothetical protein [Ignavibacteriales bacterium]
MKNKILDRLQKLEMKNKQSGILLFVLVGKTSPEFISGYKCTLSNNETNNEFYFNGSLLSHDKLENKKLIIDDII